MSRRDVADSSSDPDLPSLAQALDGSVMLPHLATVLGIEPGGCATEVLTHKPGNRATIRYEITTPGGTALAIGKVYRTVDQAQAAYARHDWLHRQLAPEAALPRAEGIVPELALVLQTYVDAPDVRHALAAGSGEEPVALAAEFLARLHRTRAAADLEEMSLGHEVAKARAWAGEIEGALPDRADTTRAAFAQLEEESARLPAYRPTTIHKDFYYAHVLWDGRQIWVVDFDELQAGDPAFDVGHFLAHLANLAYRQAGDSEAYRDMGGRFSAAYGRRAPADVRDRVLFYEAYTFLKLAATDVSRRRGDWQERAATLIGLAAEALRR